MEFTYMGARVRLQGLKSPGFDDSSSSSLWRHVRTQSASQFLHLSISEDRDATTIQSDPTAPPFFQEQLQDLLLRYDDLFSLPTGLPPVREFDHRIPFQPETALVNVRPYRYPHSQKAEIK